MGRSSCNWVSDVRLLAATAALAAAMLAGCGRGDGDDANAGSAGGGVQGALPTPAGTSGGSVTGMPTQPPASDDTAVVAEAEPAPVAEPPVDGAAPVDPNAVPIDPATGLAAGAPVPPPADAPPADVTGAATVVREYMAALGSGAFAGAQQLWSATPNDSAVLQLARGATFAVDVLPPARPADPAAGSVANVPVRVRGTADDGSARGLLAIYTVRRGADGGWRIASASVREDAP